MGNYISINSSGLSNDKKLRYTDTVKLFSTMGGPGYGRRFTFDLPNRNCVYKNLRFSSDGFNKVISRCELEVNDLRLDMLPNYTFGTLRRIYGIYDDSVIPFHFCTPYNSLPSSEHTRYSVIMEAFTEDQIDPSDKMDFNDLYILVDVHTYEFDEPINDLEYKMLSVRADAFGFTSDRYDEQFHQFFKGDYSHIIVYSPDRKMDYFVIVPERGNPNACICDAVNLDNHHIIRLDESIFEGVSLNEPIIDVVFNKDTTDGIIYFYGLHRRSAKFKDGKLYLCD